MEKGYRDYGHDIDNTDTVLEAGLGFAVALDKPGGFIGRDAVAGAEGGRAADQAPGAGAAHRSRAADVPRRDRPPRRRRRSATSGPRRTAGRSAARSAWRWSTPAASRSIRPGSMLASGLCRSATGSSRRARRSAALRPGQQAHQDVDRLAFHDAEGFGTGGRVESFAEIRALVLRPGAGDLLALVRLSASRRQRPAWVHADGSGRVRRASCLPWCRRPGARQRQRPAGLAS